ncbi:MAG: hypothetical protein IJM81_01465 [Prevotella sp.]|nr:hypothetical protein [Prevotella sp.]
MKASEQTLQQVERFIRKTAQKFPAADEVSAMTDIHVRVSQESGELLSFDDDDQELTRCVVEEWIECKDEQFYDHVTQILRNSLKRMSDTIDNLGIMKPYSFVLEDDERGNIAELYLADDDTIIIGGDLMEGLDKELDDFFKHLF